MRTKIITKGIGRGLKPLPVQVRTKITNKRCWKYPNFLSVLMRTEIINHWALQH